MQCLAPLLQFTFPAYRQATPDASLGLEVGDKEYLEEATKLNIDRPPEIFLDTKLLSLLKNTKISSVKSVVDTIRAMAIKAGLEVILVPYNSQHLPSADNAKSKGRLAVYTKKDNNQFFFQYTLETTTQEYPGLISSIVLRNQQKNNKSVELATFNDLIRSYEGDAIKVVNRKVAFGKMEPCYSCHTTAVLPILPDPTTFDEKNFGAELAKFNSKVNAASGAIIDYAPKHGNEPLFGEYNQHNVDSLIKCAKKKLKSLDLKKMTLLFKCADCHNDEDRNGLRYPTGLRGVLEGEIESLAHSMVVKNQTMPPNDFLNDEAQRKTALECMIEDYYGRSSPPDYSGRLATWLIQNKCFLDLN